MGQSDLSGQDTDTPGSQTTESAPFPVKIYRPLLSQRRGTFEANTGAKGSQGLTACNIAADYEFDGLPRTDETIPERKT